MTVECLCFETYFWDERALEERLEVLRVGGFGRREHVFVDGDIDGRGFHVERGLAREEHAS